MSDPREFNFTSQNKGTQVNIDSYWRYQITDELCSNNTKDPINLTNIVITGTIKKADGTVLVSLVETLDETQTGFFVNDAINGKFRFIIDASTSGALTENELGTYDVRFTDALLLTEVKFYGKIEFKLTASS